MIVRRFILLLGFGAGFFLGRDLLSHDVVRVLLVGLGFVAASILPTITLIVNGLTSTGRSVLAVNELHAEMVGTVKRLFGILRLAVWSVLLLLPFPFVTFLPVLDVGVVSIIDPAGKLQSGLAVLLVLQMLLALREVPSAINRSLELRKSIAVEEARQRNSDRVSQVDSAVFFPTKEGFGEKITFRADA